MRIRKRQVPLPLSSLLPVPLSDLYSNRSPTAASRYFHGQDIEGGGSASLLQLTTPPSDRLIQRDVMRKEEEEEKALDEDVDNDVDVKKSSCTVESGSKKYVNHQGESDSSTQVTLRKRRGYTSFEGQEEEDEEEEEEEDDEEEEEANKGKKKKKKKKKGKNSSSVLEEGSRCSRVNGRGWRCCQQTLYGYSLCEHHLGKGRVRSTNKSSGGRGGQKKAVKKTKRVKLGMVKARSISSLLGQTSTSSGIADVEVATESEISAPADH